MPAQLRQQAQGGWVRLTDMKRLMFGKNILGYLGLLIHILR